MANGKEEEVKPLKILLVDDDEAVRAAFAEELGGMGHQILEASNGCAAIYLIERPAEIHIDLVLTDLNLRGLVSGEEVITAVHRHRPEAKVILVSGEEETRLREVVARTGAHGYIRKPPPEDAFQRMIGDHFGDPFP